MENTPREVLDDWDAYSRCEPFGDERMVGAMIASKLSVLHGSTTGGSESIQGPQDFMPGDWLHQPKTPEPPSMQDVEAMLAKRYG